MKKGIAFILLLLCAMSFVACGSGTCERVQTLQNERGTYYELRDGTWERDGRIYRYRLEIRGRMPDASADMTFVYLSNLETISFEQAWKAAGGSSNSEDYFSAEEAVLVDWILG